MQGSFSESISFFFRNALIIFTHVPYQLYVNMDDAFSPPSACVTSFGTRVCTVESLDGGVRAAVTTVNHGVTPLFRLSNTY